MRYVIPELSVMENQVRMEDGVCRVSRNYKLCPLHSSYYASIGPSVNYKLDRRRFEVTCYARPNESIE